MGAMSWTFRSDRGLPPLVAAVLFAALPGAQAYWPPPPPHRLDISPAYLSEELLRSRGIKEVNLTLLGGYGGGW